LGDRAFLPDNPQMLYLKSKISIILPGSSNLIAICIIILIVILIKNSLLYVKAVLSVYFQASLKKYWSARIMEKYINAEYDYIVTQKRGTLINNLINEPMIASSKFIGQLIEYVSKIVMSLGIYCIMFVVNWKITLSLSLLGMFFLFLFWKFTTALSVSIGKKRLALNQEITVEGEQSLNGIRQVKLFSLEGSVNMTFSQKFSQLRDILVKLSTFQELPAPLGEVFITVCFISALVYFQYFKRVSVVEILPMFTFLIVAFGRLFENISFIVSGRLWLLSYVPGVKLISEILSSKEIGQENLLSGIHITELRERIELKNITFAHKGSNIVFQGLNMVIPRGKITAIVGKSGSGKSTLVDLLCGLYKGYTGRIIIDGRELSEINLSSWRKMIGFVSQDTFLFNTSIRENILLGNQAATEEEIVNAAKLANIHDFIKTLPKGYDTVLGDRGLKISGGQRQRITVARAIIRSPELFIFDEATSSLDLESERSIQASIENMKGKKTIIVIAHRLSTIENADLIYLLEGGRVAESGSFEELMSKRGVFYSFQR
jgi:subfamily B ATP-binding cassette protein MsbA